MAAGMPVLAKRFVGRVAELHQLEANLRAARGGAFRLVLVGGEAGVGKSRCVAEFVDHDTDVQTLIGACLPLEDASMPYGPVVDALHGLAHGRAGGEIAAIAGPAGPELARLMPELAPFPGQPAPPPPHDPVARQRFFDLLLGTIERLAEEAPVVFVIEDIQWSDAATRDLLRFLVRGLRHASVLMILTVRTDEAGGSPVSAFLGELTRLASASRIDLPRMTENEVRVLMRELTGEEPSPIAVRPVYERGDGNPFLIEQLVLAGQDGEALPPAVAEIVGVSLRGLSPATRSVLRIAAACGRRIDEGLMTTASGLDRQVVVDGIADSLVAGVLVPVRTDDGTQYQFRHALLREIVDAELAPSERQRLHHAVATALAGLPDPVPAELAHHWEAAGEWQRAAAAHLQAAAAAERLYAWVNAYQHYERARSLAERDPDLNLGTFDRGELLHRAAEAAYLAADYPAAISRGREAIQEVSEFDSPRAGTLHERLRIYLWDSGDRRGAMASVDEALRLIPEFPPSRARAGVLAQSAGVMMHTGRLDDAAERANEALEMAQRTGSMPDIGQALAMLNWIRVLKGEADEGLRGLHQAVEAAERAHDAMGIALGRALIAYLLDWMGRTSEVREVALAGHERLVKLGLQRTYGGILLGYAALADIHHGSWDEARQWLDLGLDYDETGPAGHWLRINRGRLSALQGRLQDADTDILGARETELRSGGTEYADQLAAVEAEVAMWRGAVNDARAAIEAASRRVPTAPFGPALVRAAMFGAMAEGDAAEAALMGGDAGQLEDSRRWGQRIAVFVADGVQPVSYVRESPVWIALLGGLDAEIKRIASADTPSLWATLVEQWDAAGSPLMRTYAEYRQAAAQLRDSSDRDQAYALLAIARQRCDRLGAEALGLRIDALARYGARTLSTRRRGMPTPEGPTVASDRITVHALGRLRIERGGRPVRRLGGPKAGHRQAQGMFAFLFDRGERGVTKDELIELIWSEVDLDRADGAFHRTVGGLRRALDPIAVASPALEHPSLVGQAIRFDQGRYVLDSRIIGYSDMAAFDAAVNAARGTADPMARRVALDEARGLYRGDYFDDCPYYGDSAEVEPTRARLRERMATVLLMLAELDEERGQYGAAAEMYHEALELSGGQNAGAADGLARLGALRRHLRVVAT